MSDSSPCLWTQLPPCGPAPCQRHRHACCSHQGHVYVLGGRERHSLGDLWKYSVAFNRWSQLSVGGEAAPEELEGHSMVAHQGLLLVFGGMLDSAYSGGRPFLWVYHIEKQKWLHWQEQDNPPQRVVPSNRRGHSAVVVGGAMLVYGGLLDVRGPSQDFWSLDFESRSWSLLSGSQQVSAGPGPRHGHSAVVFQGCMYLFGGLKGLREQRDLWKWTPTTHSWTPLRNLSGPPRLVGHSAVVYRDLMLVFGGGRSQDSPQSSLWGYSFSTHTWSKLDPLPGSRAPNKIHHCSAGLGPSYQSTSTSTSTNTSSGLLLPRGKPHLFKNRCSPSTGGGSEGAIELETFGPAWSSSRTDSQLDSSMTFETGGVRKRWSGPQDNGDISLHLPDQLLVLGGRPSTSYQSMSVWQMTLTDC